MLAIKKKVVIAVESMTPFKTAKSKIISARSIVLPTGLEPFTTSTEATSNYRVIVPRRPSDNNVFRSLYLHVDLCARCNHCPEFGNALWEFVNFLKLYIYIAGRYMWSIQIYKFTVVLCRDTKSMSSFRSP